MDFESMAELAYAATLQDHVTEIALGSEGCLDAVRSVSHQPPAPSWGSSALYGVPVQIDTDLAANVIEMRWKSGRREKIVLAHLTESTKETDPT